MYEFMIRRGADRFDKNTLLQHLRRAEKLGLPATLTMEEWEEATEHFEGMCAYCQEKPWQVLEHFIPLGLGGGTTSDNCVPACRSCNNAKGSYHPLQLPLNIFPGAPGLTRVDNGLERVQAYLYKKDYVEVAE
jgi:5-methylcytosine-specific restriction endonuclease McrA